MNALKLFFDVGLHMGEDTEFYLSRGCRVVGVEANPELLPILREKFASELRDDGMGFHLSHIYRACHYRACHELENRSEFRRRETVLFEDILGEYGTPYYLKIVENSD
jgi:hypothetical protein